MRKAQPSGTTAVPRFYSVAQVAEMFGMSSMTLYRAIAAGEFPAVRIRGRLIIPAKAVDTLVEVATAQQTVVDTPGGTRMAGTATSGGVRRGPDGECLS